MTVVEDARVLVDAHNSLGESPRWDVRTGRISWVDIDLGTLWSADQDGTDVRTENVGIPLGTLEFTRDGSPLITVGSDLMIRSGEGKSTVVATLSQPGVRFNDSGVDAAGRLWTATMALGDDEEPCRLHLLSPDGAFLPSDLCVGAGNGIAWNADSTAMYYVDSATKKVKRTAYSLESGTVGAIEDFLVFDEAVPDGILTDATDGLWVALWGAGELRRFTDEGTLTDIVRVSTPYITAAAFGGDDYRDLFITTARRESSDPDAGSLFAVRSRHRGTRRPTCNLGRTP